MGPDVGAGRHFGMGPDMDAAGIGLVIVAINEMRDFEPMSMPHAELRTPALRRASARSRPTLIPTRTVLIPSPALTGRRRALRPISLCGSLFKYSLHATEIRARATVTLLPGMASLAASSVVLRRNFCRPM